MPFRFAFRRYAAYVRALPAVLFRLRGWHPFLWRRDVSIARPVTVRVPEAGLAFEVTSPLDVWIIKEVCLDREYHLPETAMSSAAFVIDVGAGLGEFAIDVARRFPEAIIHAYEPHPDSFDLLRRNLERNRATNVVAHALAISATEESVAIPENRDEAISGRLTPETTWISATSVTLEAALIAGGGAAIS